MANGVIYTLNFTNNSANSGDACVYQQDPNVTDPSVFSLAWFTCFTNPNTNANFTWSIDYSFVWAQTGVLSPGVIFNAYEHEPADLTTSNQITLDYNNGFEFTNQGPAQPAGSLYITETNNVPVGKASVGIGMSNAGTFVTQAGPGLHAIFTPNPEYWITFGYYETGQVLDITVLNTPAQVSFPTGVYSMTAVLNYDNSWTIAPTSELTAWRKRRAFAMRSSPSLV
jgi:hypothetical protein